MYEVDAGGGIDEVKEQLSNLNDLLFANMITNMRIYDALMMLLPVEKSEYLNKVHSEGRVLGPVPSYFPEEDTEGGARA